MHLNLANELINNKRRAYLAQGKPFRHPGFPFHRWPERTDENHELYGEYAKRKCELYQAPKTLDGVKKTASYLQMERDFMEKNVRYIFQNKK